MSAAHTESKPSAFAIGIADVEAASRRLAGQAIVTPLMSSADLDARTGARVLVKPEPLQRTGSFKFRGAYNRISQIPAEDRGRGVVAYSSGNHAQGVACAAQMFGMKATIIMPKDSPKLKIENTRGYGADVILYDRFGESREAIGQKISAETGPSSCPPTMTPASWRGRARSGSRWCARRRSSGSRSTCCSVAVVAVG